ncbi:hypothetical protein FXF51_43055 [Nonomuraea sp. PA05]|uniref:hypothetical protein n=1 Tax=Nonomuraea sp. PA05 TaxID=2604466 RepID=UPI0011D8B47D|nr:hypothetical protein [Nonomuraea sp. PA05]TYB56563.1 hypothetical protein FXF51_43055 [Nonomuraea sp. PA05]
MPAERLRALELEITTQLWMGPGGHFVHHFVAGGRLVNFVAVTGQDTWTRESWTDRRAACLASAGRPGLRGYEAKRAPRTTRVHALSTADKARFHLPDGPEQRALRLRSGHR